MLPIKAKYEEKKTPILIVGYNRPKQLMKLVESVLNYSTNKIYISLDGPKKSPEDINSVSQVKAAIEIIAKQNRISIRFQKENLGLKRHIIKSVNWVLEENDRVIVFEDDIRISRNAIEFCENMLIKYEKNEEIFHISAYNIVPERYITNPEDLERLSIYPETYGWATWARAWKKFEIDSYSDLNLNKIYSVIGSRTSSMIWKMNFCEAEKGFINSWAYSWIATIWRYQGRCISPNRNYLTYIGQENGTHTLSRLLWKQQDLYNGEVRYVKSEIKSQLDAKADRWMSRNVFYASPKFIIYRILQSLGLMLKNLNKI
jgi:hypothetical protein